MRSKQSRGPGFSSLAAAVTRPADQRYIDVGCGLLKVGFLFSNHPKRPFLAYDLNLAQVDVLVALARAEGARLSCSEIAEKTLITKGGITGILDRLEARGLVTRMPSREDRRSILIQLTPIGIELFRKLYPELARHNRALIEKAFTRSQVKHLNELLAQLIRTLEKDSRSPTADLEVQ